MAELLEHTPTAPGSTEMIRLWRLSGQLLKGHLRLGLAGFHLPCHMDSSLPSTHVLECVGTAEIDAWT